MGVGRKTLASVAAYILLDAPVRALFLLIALRLLLAKLWLNSRQTVSQMVSG